MEDFDPFDAGQAFLQGLENLLKDQRADDAKLEFDDNSECVLAIADRFAVVLYLDTDSNAIIITIPIAPLPEDDSIVAVMSELLCGNYAWNLTEGGTLGIDRETSLITLNYLVPLPLDPPGMAEDILIKLLNIADFWERKIKDLTSTEAPTEEFTQGFLKA